MISPPSVVSSRMWCCRSWEDQGVVGWPGVLWLFGCVYYWGFGGAGFGCRWEVGGVEATFSVVGAAMLKLEVIGRMVAVGEEGTCCWFWMFGSSTIGSSLAWVTLDGGYSALFSIFCTPGLSRPPS